MRKKTARSSTKKTADPVDPVARFEYERTKRRTLSGLAQAARAGDRTALQQISEFWAVSIERLAESVADLEERAALLLLRDALQRMGPPMVLTRRKPGGKLESVYHGESPNEAFGWDRDPKARAKYEKLFEDSQRARGVAHYQAQDMTVEVAISATNRDMYPGQNREESIRKAYQRASLKKSR